MILASREEDQAAVFSRNRGSLNSREREIRGQNSGFSRLKWLGSLYRPALPYGIRAAIVPPLSGQVNWGVAKW